jgi:hypothetical protein
MQRRAKGARVLLSHHDRLLPLLLRAASTLPPSARRASPAMARRTAAAAAAAVAEPISSQLKDSFVLRSLHAWSNSPRSSILCNVAEAQDLLGHVLDDREASPLCLHLGQRPTKFVTVLGRVVGCEDREGWTRLWGE